jgi:hypothetical protein
VVDDRARALGGIMWGRVKGRERDLPVGVACRDEGGKRAMKGDAGGRRGRPVVGIGAAVRVCGEKREKCARVGEKRAGWVEMGNWDRRERKKEKVYFQP